MITKQSLFNSLQFALKSADASLKKLKSLDPDFDAGDKINAGLSRALYELERENEKPDLRNLKFSNFFYQKSFDNKATFISKDATLGLDIFYPTEVAIDEVSTNRCVIVVIETDLKNNKVVKSLVFDWEDKNLNDLADYIEKRLH